MHDIEKLRLEIDQIHWELADLFRRRLALTTRVWEIKKAQGLSFVDQKREDEIIHRFDGATTDPQEKTAIQNFFKSILRESKMYLEAKIK